MRVLVLGGTGAMGTHLVQMLSADGIETYVTSRGRRGTSGSVRYLQGNAQDIRFLSEILKGGWDAIVDFMVYETESFKARFNLLLDATPQYVFISTARVYADSKAPIKEDSPRLLDVSCDAAFLATDEYALAKARQENMLLQSGRNNWTIVRPYITYARERLQLGVFEKEDWLYRAIQGRTIVFSSDIAERVTTLTHGRDVAMGIKAVMCRPEALGETFHITASESHTWGAILTIYLDSLEQHLGVRPKVTLLDLKDFHKIHRGLYQIKYDRMFDRKFNNQKINKFVDSKCFFGTAPGLKECLGEFMASPNFHAINWRNEAMKDRLTGERSPLSEIFGLKMKMGYSLFRNMAF